MLTAGMLTAGTFNELEALKSGYAADKTRINNTCDQQKTNALSVYRQAVITQMAAAQKSGDLDSYLAFEVEKKRLEAQDTINTNDDPLLKPLVAQYYKSMRTMGSARDKATLTALRQYVGRLTTLMQNLTRANRLEAAMMVRDVLRDAQTELTFLEEDVSEDAPKPPLATTPPATTPTTPPAATPTTPPATTPTTPPAATPTTPPATTPTTPPAATPTTPPATTPTTPPATTPTTPTTPPATTPTTPPAAAAKDLAKILPGTWRITWRNAGRSGSDSITFYADRTTSLEGRWEIRNQQCLLHLPITDVTLNTTGNPKLLMGHNRQGAAITATKIGEP
jgi:hypothetical protein